jgi:regulator of cell morphogenesis and NO signaling
MLPSHKHEGIMRGQERTIIDVTVIEPKLRHPVIFQKFDELAFGEEITIYNDHDPKPLFYQLQVERGPVFEWNYIEQGPIRWAVNIRKTKTESAATIGEIVAMDWRKAEVLKRYGIDFCCGGKRTLQSVCAEKHLDIHQVEKELLTASVSSGGRALPFNEWDVSFLAEYIMNTHHTYVRKALPELRAYAYKVSTVHGEFHSELNSIHELVDKLNEELLDHLYKEENILFPYIKKLAENHVPTKPHFGSIGNPIAMMEHEHDEAGKILQKIRKLSIDFMVPEDACASFRLFYQMLQQFESDLHTHIHLENNILFPKAIKLEEEGCK